MVKAVNMHLLDLMFVLTLQLLYSANPFQHVVTISLTSLKKPLKGILSFGRLVRELRDNSLFVPGFQTSELNLFVHNVTTSYTIKTDGLF